MKSLTTIIGILILFSVCTLGFSDTCSSFSVNYTQFDLCSFSEGVDPFTVSGPRRTSLIFSLQNPNVTSCDSDSDKIWGILTNRSSELDCINIAVNEPTYSFYGIHDLLKAIYNLLDESNPDAGLSMTFEPVYPVEHEKYQLFINILCDQNGTNSTDIDFQFTVTSEEIISTFSYSTNITASGYSKYGIEHSD